MSFTYVGRLDELKGIKCLFEAWRLMGKKGPVLNVCGTGPLYEWCCDFIDKYGMNGIKMRGHIEHEQVMALIYESDAIIVPSLWYEGFPMIIVEAYSAGIPVIGSNIGNVGSLIEENTTGLTFNTTNVQELVSLISTFDNTHFSRSRILQNTKQYNPENNYLILKEVYESIQQ